ncbi:hypothetical protein LPJ60_003478 [Coemansia sp. RSA 2675]|uniref:Uncharacterized protein n=1 Tax=Coemansia linderi TaxID=2663919 RepID=A0ACC1KHJ7_9FUNG|nr:hypothetical protein LPJ60_003478 [Coemansia sp. RSA 2675]KAJ2415851.1 hypothetical protein GGI10_001411 [Coemansia sp. RSA 2530]KAJ2696926.1 hypothetical protein H4218_004292 [Coemansia sp. IMI 209128]KAJ2789873.1 hypothetical protein GGI18_002148 [Coemansia linderi]
MSASALFRTACTGRAGLPAMARHSKALGLLPSIQAALFSGSGSAPRKKVMFPGALTSEYTHDLRFASSVESIPTYQVMDTDGRVLDAANEPHMSKEEARNIYKNMLILNAMDQILYEAQRQGRISFYMTSFGEEALIGSAAALDSKDHVFGQYREAGVLLQRGFTLEQFMNQCYSNEKDLGKGRQMPIHYGSKELHFQTISSPLATQIPQAAGAAYAMRREGSKQCAICYFGEGAASEGDFHAGLNMAATLGCPVIFYCRNNGYAISTPSIEQYRGDGIASRGIGYGIDTIRVDGNDIWAIYSATKAARKIAVEQNKPVLIEAMTYRVSHHSTSDDSSAYRSTKEVEDWSKRDNPISRMRAWLEGKGWWTKSEDAEVTKAAKADVLRAFAAAETLKKPSIRHLFEDVYDQLPPELERERAEIEGLIRKYPDYYQVNEFAK